MEDLIFNYYFLNAFCAELEKTLEDATVEYAFSASGNELDMVFVKAGINYKLKLYLGQKHRFFTFHEFTINPPRTARYRYSSLNGKKLTSIHANKQDRSFSISFKTGEILTYKLYGRNSNIVLFNKEKKVHEMLFPARVNDKSLTPVSFNRRVGELTKQAFMLAEEADELEALYSITLPSFTPVFLAELHKSFKVATSAENKWDQLQALLEYLKHPGFYVVKEENPVYPSAGISLSLFKPETGEWQAFDSAIDATNSYASEFFRVFPLMEVKHQLQLILRDKIKKLEKRKHNLQVHIAKLEKHDNYRLFADLLMANLHQLPAKQEQAVLNDFESGEPLTIPLKKDLNVQENAARYYRKARNRHKEEEHTFEQLLKVEEELRQQMQELEEVEASGNQKELKKLLNSLTGEEKQQGKVKDFFREFSFKGYSIYVGRSSENNDKLTLHFAAKNDLWLHARDVSGSHVIVRVKGVETVPSDVLEMAARLAVYYSKARGSAYYPVIYTFRKFVRKRKGAPAGQVIVEKPELIMAESLGQEDLEILAG